MLVRDAFHILGIEKTDDKRAIKGAYRKLLPLYNPEENEEKFLILRDAYDTAMDYAQNKVEEEVSEQEEIEIEELSLEYQETYEEIVLSKEERVIQEILAEIESMYGDKDQRNNPEKWAVLLENDIFLSLDYGQRTKREIIKCLSDKYLLKTNIWKLVFEKLELYNRELNLWDWAPKEYILFFMGKIRDISDYTDFLYDDIQCQDLQAVCEELQGYLMGNDEVSYGNPRERMAELFGVDEKDTLLQQIEQMVEKYPRSIYWRLWAMDVCDASDMDAETWSSVKI